MNCTHYACGWWCTCKANFAYYGTCKANFALYVLHHLVINHYRWRDNACWLAFLELGCGLSIVSSRWFLPYLRSLPQPHNTFAFCLVHRALGFPRNLTVLPPWLATSSPFGKLLTPSTKNVQIIPIEHIFQLMQFMHQFNILAHSLLSKGRDVINASWWLALTRNSSFMSNNCNAQSPSR